MKRSLVSFFCACLFIASTVAFAKQKIIIDTDPGVDDLLAISLAMQSDKVEVLGITTVFGNVTTQQATNNALTLMEFFNQSIPVYEGAYLPLKGSSQKPTSFVHGLDGLGGVYLPLPTTTMQPQTAAQFIIEQVHRFPNQVKILVLGPETNLAEALRQDPSIANKVQELVIMGGAFSVDGNINAHSEANIWHDPDAAQEVAQASWPKTYVGLDVTMQLLLNDSVLLEIADQLPFLGNFLVDASAFYFDFHKEYYGIEHQSFMHDPTAFLYITHPQAFETLVGDVSVDLEGDERGRTRFKRAAKGHASICYQIQAGALTKAFKTTLLSDNSALG